MPHRIRVGIVGAGIAGSTAAIFLRQARPDAVIRVFEQEAAVGGRIQTIDFHNYMIEIGASFFHSSNRLLSELAASVGLELRERHRLDTEERHPAGVWDGRRFIAVLPNHRIASALYLLARYGNSVVRMRRCATRMLERWNRIYALQDSGASFASPGELVDALELLDLARQDTYRFLAGHRVSHAAVRALFNSASRSIYNQDARINALAGMVTLVGTNMAGGRTVSIAGGNSKICDRLLQKADADVRVRTKVRAVTTNRAGHDGSVSLMYDEGPHETFDAVIVAAPMSMAKLEIEEGRPAEPAEAAAQTTHVLCVKGRLVPTYFGVADERDLPRTILTVESADIPFSTIVRNGPPDTLSDQVYTIQSRQPLEDRLLRDLFVSIDDRVHKVWSAYPTLTPARSYPSFVLANGVYYANAMESVVSTLETQTVASRNAVALLLRHLGQEA